MPNEVWRQVDRFIESTLLGHDSQLTAALAANQAADLPAIDVTQAQGKLLYLLALTAGARRILEIGTLGGYSSICLARALPAGGRLDTLEAEAAHVAVARANLAHAGLADKVTVHHGPALETLADFSAQGVAPYDLVFIDADKPSNPAYFDWALRLSRPGTLVVLDNVVRDGSLADAASNDPAVVATRTVFETAGKDGRIESTAIQTVGAKGYDGFLLARVV